MIKFSFRVNCCCG